MKSQTRIATALVVILGLVGGGYLLGTNGSGGAQASNTPTTSGAAQDGPGEAGRADKTDGHRGQELSALATKLGVSTTKLQEAMDKLRGQRTEARDAAPKGRENADAQALATELGVDVNKVVAALAKAEGPKRSGGDSGRNHDHAAKDDNTAKATSLAQSLNIPETKVKAALDKLDAAEKSKGEQKHQQMAADLAKALGLPTQKVTDALTASRPGDGPEGH